MKREPVIVWPGGKGSQVEFLQKMMPLKWNNYYEPFFGGGALFFELERQGLFCLSSMRVPVINDANVKLMNLYKVVQEKHEELITELKALSTFIGPTEFLKVRHMYNFNTESSDVELAAMFMYLNRLGFNGLYRVNSRGHYNVNYRKAPRDIVRESAVRKAHEALERVEMFCGGYEVACSSAEADDLVYMDPPYWPKTKTANFTSYSVKFEEEEQIKLASFARALSSKGVFVMLSNSDVPEVRDLYQGWNIQETSERRGINCDGAKRGPVGTLLMRNFR